MRTATFPVRFAPPRASVEKSNRWLIALTAIWAIAVAVGMVELWIYKLTPAPEGSAPLSWPETSRIPHDLSRATLVMLAHPKCPCTRASLQELASLLSESGGKIRAHVLFMKPGGSPDAWEESDTWRQAAAIPGVDVVRDPDGDEARRFGAVASGHVVVYAASGDLLFEGGITKARGHAGGNVGRDRILSLVTKGRADRRTSPTFGCSLFDDGSAREDRNGRPQSDAR